MISKMHASYHNNRFCLGISHNSWKIYENQKTNISEGKNWRFWLSKISDSILFSYMGSHSAIFCTLDFTCKIIFPCNLRVDLGHQYYRWTLILRKHQWITKRKSSVITFCKKWQYGKEDSCLPLDNVPTFRKQAVPSLR